LTLKPVVLAATGDPPLRLAGARPSGATSDAGLPRRRCPGASLPVYDLIEPTGQKRDDMKRKNIETLLAWLDALRRGDREAVSGTLEADIVWQGVRDDLVCYGPRRSRTASQQPWPRALTLRPWNSSAPSAMRSCTRACLTQSRSPAWSSRRASTTSLRLPTGGSRVSTITPGAPKRSTRPDSPRAEASGVATRQGRRWRLRHGASDAGVGDNTTGVPA
jgi:hypothetical protein